MIIVLSLPFIGELRDLHFVFSQDQRRCKWLWTGSVPRSGRVMSLVWPWCVFGRGSVCPFLWQELEPAQSPQSWVRAGGWAGTGLGMKFPSSAHQNWGQSIPWHTPKSASTGCGCCKHSPRDPERSRVRALGGCSHPGAPPQSPLTAWAHGMSLCSHISGKREMKSSPVIIY